MVDDQNNAYMIALNEDIRMIIADEAGEINAGNYDGIKEDLREIAGIPNASYKVVDDKVFVFSKLAELVAKHPKRDQQPLDELAISLITEATVSAQEAVSEWGIVPYPYEVVGSLASSFTIRHKAFNACLPGVFRSEDEVKKVFAHLLVSGIQPGSGDFHYREQPMTLCAPLDTASIPQRPVLWGSAGDDCSGYPLLRNVEYEPGFEPLSESLFTELKEREAAWKADDSCAALTAREHSVALWARASSFRLNLLDDPSTKISQDEEEDLAELRPLYPELPMLSDASLYHLFDDYQSEVSYISGWTASRDDDFLFYLLGKVAVFPAVPQTATDTGLWSAYALVNGESVESAFAYAQTATLYDSAITTAALRVATAIRFLIEAKNQTEQCGRPITTLGDAYRTARKFGTQVVFAEQRLSDLGRGTDS